MGGYEFVYSKRLASLALGEMKVQDFEIQIGAMHYGFPLHGLLGMDFLVAARALIDLGALEVKQSAVANGTP